MSTSTGENQSINFSAPRSLAVVTGGRSDYGPLVPLLRAIQADRELELRLCVTGAHFAKTFGSTINEIYADGFSPAEKVEMLLASDTPEAVSKSIGVGVLGFAEFYAQRRPDMIVGLGDRFELLAAVTAALPFGIPVAHISGGEVTEGAIDESIRHSLTKLSHLHFVAAEPYGRRVIQLGEEPWRVHITGEPSLDCITSMDFLSDNELEARIGIGISPKPLVVTYHPVTLEHDRNRDYVENLLAALRESSQPIVFTYPNADAGSSEIIEAINRFVAMNSNARAVQSLGRRAYCSLLKSACAMVGNSSSGIIEAASFELPVVNIGSRQRGRLHGENVIDCEPERKAIGDAIRKATSPEFRASVRGIHNLYGDGHASERIVKILRETPLNKDLVVKRFHDVG